MERGKEIPTRELFAPRYVSIGNTPIGYSSVANASHCCYSQMKIVLEFDVPRNFTQKWRMKSDEVKRRRENIRIFPGH